MKRKICAKRWRRMHRRLLKKRIIKTINLQINQTKIKMNKLSSWINKKTKPMPLLALIVIIKSKMK